MGYDKETLRYIFEKTNGYCIYCGKKLSWINYGNSNGKGGWEVDHSRSKSKGGTDHLNNLVPSCIPCNRNKGTLTKSQYQKQFEQESEEPIIGLISGLLIVGGLLWFFRQISKGSRKNYNI